MVVDKVHLAIKVLAEVPPLGQGQVPKIGACSSARHLAPHSAATRAMPPSLRGATSAQTEGGPGGWTDVREAARVSRNHPHIGGQAQAHEWGGQSPWARLMGGGGVSTTTKCVHRPLLLSPAVHLQAPEEFNVQTCLTHIWVIAGPFDCPVFLRTQEPTIDLIYMQGRVGKL